MKQHDMEGSGMSNHAETDIAKGAPKTKNIAMEGGGGETPPMTQYTVDRGGQSYNDKSMPKGDTSLTGDV